MVRVRVLIAIVAAGALPGCGGTSAQERAASKAKVDVCSATADVGRRLGALDALPASQLDPQQTVGEVTGIAVRLKQVRDAFADLDAARAAQLRTAEAAFQEDFGTVVSGLVGGTTLGAENIGKDLAPALNRLDRRWQATLGQATGAWCR